MLRKKKWVIISIVAAAIVLIAGVLGGIAVSAQTPTPTPTPTGGTDLGKTVMARVAEKLGIDQADLEAAFKEATQETRDEAVKAKLKSLVDQGRITQEQADQWQTWWQSRPDVPAGLNGLPGLGPQGKMRPGRMFRGGFGQCGPGCPGASGWPAPTTQQ